MARRRFTVPPAGKGARLDKYLSDSMRSELSRSRIARLIDGGLVLVSGERRPRRHILTGGEEIEITIPEGRESGIEAEEGGGLKIVYDDGDIIVLDKPSGIVVHPSPGHRRGTLVNLLLSRYPEMARVGSAKRPGVVHRLDMNTSGLIAFAGTARAYSHLTSLIKERALKRGYTAVVHGNFREDEGLIEAPIGRHPHDRLRMAVRPSGRPARTRFFVRERFRRISLMEVELDTGRTHQIRVHMAHIGRPVIGDSVYGRGSPPLVLERGGVKSEYRFPRQALHASSLSFPDLDGRVLSLSSPLPGDMAALLGGLRDGSIC